jgi:hypothetical protein
VLWENVTEVEKGNALASRDPQRPAVLEGVPDRGINPEIPQANTVRVLPLVTQGCAVR